VEREKQMLDELKRNGSGYYDPTAYEAIKNLKEDEEMELKRGDIYLCHIPGKEPTMYLNVSAEGRTGMFASMIMLTEKDDLLYGVPIKCKGIKYASCDLVMYLKKEYLTNFVKCATADEMAGVDKMMAKALGLAEMDENERYRAIKEENLKLKADHDAIMSELIDTEAKLKEAQKKIPVFPVEIEKELLKAETQRDMYKELYEQMLEKMMG
jgi:mRNA interferase MazF